MGAFDFGVRLIELSEVSDFVHFRPVFNPEAKLCNFAGKPAAHTRKRNTPNGTQANTPKKG